MRFEQLMESIQRENFEEQNKMTFSARFSASLRSREGISLRDPLSAAKVRKQVTKVKLVSPSEFESSGIQLRAVKDDNKGGESSTATFAMAGERTGGTKTTMASSTRDCSSRN